MTALVPRGAKGYSFQLYGPLSIFVSQFGWVNSGVLKEVNGVLHLRCKLVPKLDGKVHINCAKGTDELILESLDGFVSVDAVIA